MRVSIVIPSKGCEYIRYLFTGLRNQTINSFEVILVIKDCILKAVEKLCQDYSLNCVVIEQKEGNVTQALNMGKKGARGDITIFTDDDAIPLQRWVERYIKMHYKFKNVVGISSRDIYIDVSSLRVLLTPDDKPEVRLYRLFVRSWLERPHPLLKEYRLGVYLTKKLDIAHGICIPNSICYSLAFRGVNMSFKTNYIYDAIFPEHRLLKRAVGFEQHFSLQLVLKGFDLIYVPNNPVLHIARSESLSRTKYRKELKKEFEIMKSLYKNLINEYKHKQSQMIRAC
jgi:glycosyltransferase involved in cell wall biosynthesis